MESVQSYNEGGWDYTTELRKFVEGGMTGTGFIDGVSGIVNRGCHNPVSRPSALAPNICKYAMQGFSLTLFSVAMWHWRIRWGRGARPKLQEGAGCVLWWLSSPGGVIFERFASWVSSRLRSIHGIWCFGAMVSRLQRSILAWKMCERSSHSKWQTII